MGKQLQKKVQVLCHYIDGQTMLQEEPILLSAAAVKRLGLKRVKDKTSGKLLFRWERHGLPVQLSLFPETGQTAD